MHHPLTVLEVHQQELRHRLERSLARPDDRSARPRTTTRPSARVGARGRPPDTHAGASEPPGPTSSAEGATAPSAGDPPAAPVPEEDPARPLVAVAP